MLKQLIDYIEYSPACIIDMIGIAFKRVTNMQVMVSNKKKFFMSLEFSINDNCLFKRSMGV